MAVPSATDVAVPAGERSRTVLGLGLILAGLAAMTWPMFIIGRLRFQCSPPADARDSATCADGISYLLSAVHIGFLSLVAVVVILMAYRHHARRRSRGSRILFGSTALTGPALIAFVVLDSPPVDVVPAAPALIIAVLSACLSIVAAMAGRRISLALGGAAALAALTGILLEPGVASPLLACASIAVAASLAPSASPS